MLRYSYLLLALLSTTFLVNDIVSQSSGKVHIYCLPKSPNLEVIMNYFNDKSDWEVTFCSLNDSICLSRFLTIVDALTLRGIDVLPAGTCLPCELQYSTWNDILITYASPLIVFSHNGRPTAVTIGITNHMVLEQATMMNASYVKIFTLQDSYALSYEGVQLEALLLGEENGEKTKINLLDPISSIVLLALVDSINPCTFAVFTALLFLSLSSFGKIKAATVGFSFILAIFIGYYILGLGLLPVLTFIPYVDKILAAVGCVIGFLSIIRGFEHKLNAYAKSLVPESFRRFIELWITKYYARPTLSFILGFIASFTLLPCSSGPYVVGLGLLSTVKESIKAYLLLALYNIVFVTPLIVILAAILASSVLAHKIKVLRSAEIGVMELINGILLVALCIYLLLS